MTCPQCGERLQEDKRIKRKLCRKCRTVMDRDVVAAVNLSRRGRFARSRPLILEAQGGAIEAMKQDPTTMVIPGVDAPKSVKEAHERAIEDLTEPQNQCPESESPLPCPESPERDSNSGSAILSLGMC